MAAQITADYLLQMAERIERNGTDFYRMAVAHVQDTATVQLLLQLAAKEVQHEQIFAEMRSRLGGSQAGPEPAPDSEIAGYLRGLLAGKFFDIRARPEDFFGENDSPRDVLLTAIRLEKETIVFYEGVKRVMPEKDAAVVEAVLREEMGHVAQLVQVLQA